MSFKAVQVQRGADLDHLSKNDPASSAGSTKKLKSTKLSCGTACKALGYMQLHRIYKVVQGFIPAAAEYVVLEAQFDVGCWMFDDHFLERISFFPQALR